ncbi:MAG: hypothetical protein I4O51_09435 [Flavobacterium micromati]|nr:hypothetical protein [Flavobacterium micromati]
MKSLAKTIGLITFVLLLTNLINAQNQQYLVQQDQVKPSMQVEYEKTLKEFIEDCKKNNLQGTNWTTARMSDGKYLYISPIEKMADLDRNWFAPLSEKMGKENLQKYWDKFDKCYDKNGNYTVSLVKDLSYMPNGLTTNTVGQDFRKYHFFYVTPSNAKNMAQEFKAIKTIFEKKKSKEHYRIYRSGFGIIGEYYLVVLSSKDEQSYAVTSDENNILLGEEWQKAFDQLMLFTDKYETVSGMMRPDLSYVTKK